MSLKFLLTEFSNLLALQINPNTNKDLREDL